MTKICTFKLFLPARTCQNYLYIYALWAIMLKKEKKLTAAISMSLLSFTHFPCCLLCLLTV